MQAKLFTLVAVAALGGMLVTGCSKPADTSSSTDSTASASAAPAAAASAEAPAGATEAPAAAAATTEAAATSAPAAAASSAMSSSDAKTVASAGDAEKGEKIYSANCAACHGAKGAGGGVGPTLKGEKARKDTAAAIAWIKNPAPPMPKLYPSPLSEKDVADVAAYVESL